MPEGLAQNPGVFAMELHVKPLPKPRPRMGRNGHIHTPKRAQDFEKHVATVAHNHMFRQGLRHLKGPLKMDLIFISAYPKSWPKRKKTPSWKTSTPDLDNLVKAIADGMNGIVFKDDSQIAVMTAQKRHGEEDHIWVQVTEIKT